MRKLKINEVEALVGITKKNIRFYEAEVLLCPQRNSENGYRKYGDEDVETLRRIKLLRKLGLPLEEIRSLQTGRLTVSDAMRRHRVTLERDRESLEQSIRLCGELADCHEMLDGLDAQSLLDRMEQRLYAPGPPPAPLLYKMCQERQDLPSAVPMLFYLDAVSGNPVCALWRLLRLYPCASD